MKRFALALLLCPIWINTGNTKISLIAHLHRGEQLLAQENFAFEVDKDNTLIQLERNNISHDTTTTSNEKYWLTQDNIFSYFPARKTITVPYAIFYGALTQLQAIQNGTYGPEDLDHFRGYAYFPNIKVGESHTEQIQGGFSVTLQVHKQTNN